MHRDHRLSVDPGTASSLAVVLGRGRRSIVVWAKPGSTRPLPQSGRGAQDHLADAVPQGTAT